MYKKLTTPVLFLIFNRPDTSERVFSEIRSAKPSKLFVAADGPRQNKEGEAEKCQAARDVIKQVDWDCEVKTLFRDKNLGCKVAVSSAIDWFFENVEEGIILEDDCLPSRSFFWFCQELLSYYQDDKRVSSISGSNPFNDSIDVEYSYFFSKYNRIWGWATWRRAWRLNDVNISLWPELKSNLSHYAFFQSPREARFYERFWDKCFAGEIDTWDYQWYLCKLMQFSCTAVSAQNLISNIGFGTQGAHTHHRTSDLAEYPLYELEWPLKHPPSVYINYRKDWFTTRYRYNPPFLTRIKRLLFTLGYKLSSTI